MGALPKQRTSRSRQGERRAHFHLALPNLIVCPQCRKPSLPHHVCTSCGYYRNKQIILPSSSK